MKKFKKFFASLSLMVIFLFVGFCLYIGYRNFKDINSIEQKLVPFDGTTDYFRISQTGNVETYFKISQTVNVETSCDVVKILAEMLEKDPESRKSDEFIALDLLTRGKTRSLVFCKIDTSIWVEVDNRPIFYSPKKGLISHRESDFEGYKNNEILHLFNREIKRWSQYFDSSPTKK